MCKEINTPLGFLSGGVNDIIVSNIGEKACVCGYISGKEKPRISMAAHAQQYI